ncbi:hypothetical protein PTTG_02457 [Puccinia triticina 1-1 BBBD Race 1]|uniref:Pentacotripeptide-repeat region of PRORP domain-containing protein n=1 Tax=Puccinia triticina (isolate 1-1 / race 1 (BBBD)) TaxID=630390 RepID=A0A180H2H9_PUCT1|nr:hypothetical protein PTTG_02457 [Puccinia triticina 1-1 BBBD Race 1]
MRALRPAAAQHWFRQNIPPYHQQQPHQPGSRTADPLLFPTHSQQPPEHQQQPIRYPAHPADAPPKLSRAIASFHNAALVYLHRGLAIHSAQPALHPAVAPQPQEPFLSAVTKGFNQILLLETGLEFAQSRQVMEALLSIVRQKLSLSENSEHQHRAAVWEASKQVIIHCALRPRMASVGEWAWEEIRRGNYDRLAGVWTGILEIVDRRHGPADPSQPPPTIGLDEGFFTALVVVSSTLNEGPPLGRLVGSLVDRIWSRVRPADRLPLDRLPQPARARFFLRAVELGLLWRRPAEDEPEHADWLVEQDERIVHLIRRNFLAQHPHSLQYCLDLSQRIQEAVKGAEGEPGWLPVDWTPQPTTTTTTTTPSSSEDPKKKPSQKREIILTQKVVGTLLTGFAENGMIEQVEQLIGFSRRLGGMSRYLWSAVLRGVTKQSQAGALMKEFVRRMEAEDGLELDFTMRCIQISGCIGSDLDGALAAIDELLVHSAAPGGKPGGSSSSSSSSSSGGGGRKKGSKLPIDAINSIVSALLRHQMLERAESLLEALSDRLVPNTTTLNHFLNYHSRLQHPILDHVLAHLKRFEDQHVKPDVVSFTILLNILLKLGSGQHTIQKLLAMMELAGVEPNAITYGSIIHHLCRSGKIEDVEVADKLLEEIEERGIATTDITYTALIQGFLRAHIQEYEARTDGFHQPSSSAGGGGTHGAEGEGRKLVRATELIGRLKERGKLNQVVYNALLNALFSTRQFESGVQVFKVMRAELAHSSSPGSKKKEGIELYGNGLIDSYGIMFRRLIQFGQLDLFHTLYYHHFRNEMFTFVPLWIEKLIDRFENSK